LHIVARQIIHKRSRKTPPAPGQPQPTPYIKAANRRFTPPLAPRAKMAHKQAFPATYREFFMAVANALIASLLEVTHALLGLYVWVLIIGAVLSWLLAFGVINPYNRAVNTVNDVITRITEPVLVHFRRVIPPIGGIDLSPVALIFVIYFLQSFIRRLMF
jgi:YggT family protein